MSLAGDEQILEMSSANIVLLFEWRKRNVIFLLRSMIACSEEMLEFLDLAPPRHNK